jgi:hypothetical protein
VAWICKICSVCEETYRVHIFYYTTLNNLEFYFKYSFCSFIFHFAPFWSKHYPEYPVLQHIQPKLSTNINMKFLEVKVKAKSYITTDGQAVLVSGTHLGPATNFSRSFFNYFLTVTGLLMKGCSLWREVGSEAFSCCWTSPAQSSSGVSRTRLTSIFYCLYFLRLLQPGGQCSYIYFPLEQGEFWEEPIAYFSLTLHRLTENDAFNIFYIVEWVFVAAVTFLPSRCATVHYN